MSELDQKLLDHFLNPRNIGMIEKPDGYARVENPINGYTTVMYLKIKKDKIQDLKFKTFGCTATIASTSALTEAIMGKTLDEIVDNGEPLERLLELIREKLGTIPQRNWHCPPTAIQALMAAIYDYFHKNKEEEKVEKVNKIIIDIKKYFEKYSKN